MLALNYRVAQLDPRQRLMLDFAWKLAMTPHLVDDSERDALSQQGLSPETFSTSRKRRRSSIYPIA
jgi:alkylhydroperoxidase family enzyme